MTNHQPALLEMLQPAAWDASLTSVLCGHWICALIFEANRLLPVLVFPDVLMLWPQSPQDPTLCILTTLTESISESSGQQLTCSLSLHNPLLYCCSPIAPFTSSSVLACLLMVRVHSILGEKHFLFSLWNRSSGLMVKSMVKCLPKKDLQLTYFKLKRIVSSFSLCWKAP